jgi:cell division protein FtsA
MDNNRIIVGLDVGTSKICVVVGEAFNDHMDIIGMGIAESKGLRKGVVVNIEDTIDSIKQAIREAESTSNVEIGAVNLGVAGGHINSFHSHGVIPVKDNEITQKDLDRVVEAAQSVAIPFDREILHVLPMEYIVDGHDGIRDPRGMSGVRLEAKVHIITGAVTSVQNLIKCCQRTGLDVNDIVLQPIASAESVLNEDEKELGVGLVDIGGGTTDIAIFRGGTLIHTAVINIGGSNFTHDIAVGLRTPSAEAERIKKEYGSVLTSMVERDNEIEVTYAGGRPSRMIPGYYVAEILQHRGQEICEYISDEFKKKNYYDMIASGAVLTGGSSLMKGLIQMAESVLDMPVRIGKPTCQGTFADVVSSPEYSTAVGLVLYCYKESGSGARFQKGGVIRNVFGKMKYWVKGIIR